MSPSFLRETKQIFATFSALSQMVADEKSSSHQCKNVYTDQKNGGRWWLIILYASKRKKFLAVEEIKFSSSFCKQGKIYLTLFQKPNVAYMGHNFPLNHWPNIPENYYKFSIVCIL